MMNTNEFRAAVKQGINVLRRQPSERKGYWAIPTANISPESPCECKFLPDGGYFQVIVSEMFLKDRREYWNEFLPFVLVVCDFLYNRERRTVPVFAGKEVLQGLERYLADEAVEYRNTELIAPTPYAGGAIGLLMGLFRSQTRRHMDDLMGMVGALGQVFQIGNLTQYLQLAVPLKHAIDLVLGMEDVQLRMAIRDVFDGSLNRDSEYFLIANCPDSRLKRDELWVDDGILVVGPKHCTQRIKDFDYCLVRLKFSSDRNFAALPSAELWIRIKALIWQNQIAKAEATFLELCGQLATSPDLITPHRFNLIRVYKMNLESEIELFRSTTNGTRLDRTERDPVAVSSPTSRLQDLIPAAKEAGLQSAIFEMTEKWGNLPYMMTRPMDLVLTSEILQQQMMHLNVSQDRITDLSAVSMAEVLASTALKSRGRVGL